MHVLPLRRFVAGTLVFLFPLTALAATRTWDAGGSDTNWSTAANWSDNTVPTAADIALFDGTGKKNATIDAAFGGSIAELRLGSSNTGTITAVRSLTVNGNVSLSGGTLAINGGNTMTVQKSWQNDGNATFTSNTGTVLLTGSGTSYILKEFNAFKHLSLDDGLIGYWKFDETSGTSAADSSRYGNNGTLTGDPTISSNVPTVDFSNPQSLSLDGTDDYMNAAAFTVTPRTVSYWIKPNAAITSTGPADGLMDFGNNSTVDAFGYTGAFTSAFNGETITFSSNSKFTATYITETIDTNWHHLVITSTDGTRWNQVYIDGVAVTTNLVGGGAVIWNNGFTIGKTNYVGLDDYFRGSFDDVRVYSRSLSASEVAALSAGNPGTGSGTYTLGSAISVNGNLNIYSGNLDVSASNYGITASGSLVNSALLTVRSATVTLNGIGTTLKVYGASIYNLTIATGKSAILRAAATVTNALTLAANTTLNLNGYSLTATIASISNLGTITEGTGAILHTSSLSASPATLAIGSSISISLTDSDANVDGTARETVTVTANGETITLTETSNASGIFTGSVATAHGAGVAGNGIIENNDACSFFVNAVYADPQNGADWVSARVTVTDSGVPCEIGGGGGGGGSRAGLARVTTTVPASPAPSPSSTPSSASTPTPTAPSTFQDVPVSAWFFAAVQELASLGIISGYKDTEGNALNRFGPADPVTFAEALKMTLGVSGADIPPSGVPSIPALRAHWSVAYLSYAETLGLSLFPTTASIDQPLTRGKLAQLLMDILEPPPSDDALSFTDVASSHEHAAAIRIVAAQGWMMGDTDASGALLHRFRPDDSLNRAEVAQVLVRVLRWRKEL